MMMFCLQASLYFEAATFFTNARAVSQKSARLWMDSTTNRKTPLRSHRWRRRQTISALRQRLAQEPPQRHVPLPEMHPGKAAHGTDEVLIALQDAAQLEGTISEGDRRASRRYGFADEVVVQWLPDDDKTHHVAQLREAVRAFGAFAAHAIRAYMATRLPGTLSAR